MTSLPADPDAASRFRQYLLAAGALTPEPAPIPGISPADQLFLELRSVFDQDRPPPAPVSFELDGEYGWTYRSSRSAVLTQLLGQACTVLTGLGITPPTATIIDPEPDPLTAPAQLRLGNRTHPLVDPTDETVAGPQYELLRILQNFTSALSDRRWYHAPLDDAAGPVLFLDLRGRDLADAAYRAVSGGYRLVEVAGGRQLPA